MNYTNILTISESLNEYYKDSLNFEILFRRTEPQVLVKAYKPSDGIMVCIYMSAEKANTIEEAQVKELINFLIEQELYRRKVVKDNVFQTKND